MTSLQLLWLYIYKYIPINEITPNIETENKFKEFFKSKYFIKQ